MLVKTEFKFLWGGKPKKETFEGVVKITSKAPYTEAYSHVVLYFKDGHTEEVDYSSISIESEEEKVETVKNDPKPVDDEYEEWWE